MNHRCAMNFTGLVLALSLVPLAACQSESDAGGQTGSGGGGDATETDGRSTDNGGDGTGGDGDGHPGASEDSGDESPGAGASGGGAGDAPALADRSDIVFQTSFETEDWLESWTGGKNNWAIVDPLTKDDMPTLNGKALEVTIQADENLGIDAKYDLADADGVYPESMFARYYVYFAENWKSYAGKTPGWSGTETAGWGGKKADGTNGWSARTQMRPHSNETRHVVQYYVYHAQQETDFGDHYFWEGGAEQIETGQWYCIEQFAKINTPGEDDGELRAWLDGELVFEKTDIRMREVAELKLKSFWVNYWANRPTVVSEPRQVYMDDLVIAKDARIPCHAD